MYMFRSTVLNGDRFSGTSLVWLESISMEARYSIEPRDSTSRGSLARFFAGLLTLFFYFKFPESFSTVCLVFAHKTKVNGDKQ